MKNLIYTIPFIFLTGCGAVDPIAGGVGGAAAVIAGSVGISATTLSEVAAAGCAAQAAANVAGAVAQQQGSLEWTKHFAEASKIAGFACAW